MPGPLPRRSLVVHVPVSSHKTSAFPTLGMGRRLASPCSDFCTVPDFGAAVIRFVQASRFACHPGRSHRYNTAVWRPWLLRPSTVEVVTFPHVGYASRPNRAIDGRGLSPLKIRGLVGCSPNARPQARERAGARHERRLFPVACRPLLGAVLGEMLRRPPCYSALTLLPTSGAPRTPPAPLPNRRCCSGLKFLIFLGGRISWATNSCHTASTSGVAPAACNWSATGPVSRLRSGNVRSNIARSRQSVPDLGCPRRCW